MKTGIVLLICTSLTLVVKAQEKMRKEQDVIYTYVERMPRPSYDLGEYISNTVHYPDSARYHNTEGRVVIKFVVNEDGHISDCVALSHLGDGLEEEGVRVMSNMPKWIPAMQNGVPVKVYFTQPFNFKLEDDVPAPAAKKHK